MRNHGESENDGQLRHGPPEYHFLAATSNCGFIRSAGSTLTVMAVLTDGTRFQKSSAIINSEPQLSSDVSPCRLIFVALSDISSLLSAVSFLPCVTFFAVS